MQSLWKFVQKLLKILKLELPYEPSTPLLSVQSKDSTSYYIETCTSMFKAVLFTIARNQNQPKCQQLGG